MICHYSMKPRLSRSLSPLSPLALTTLLLCCCVAALSLRCIQIKLADFAFRRSLFEPSRSRLLYGTVFSLFFFWAHMVGLLWPSCSRYSQWTFFRKKLGQATSSVKLSDLV